MGCLIATLWALLPITAESPPKLKVAVAFAYTTDSEISPEELDKWEVVMKSDADARGFYCIVAENPELRLNCLDCPVKYVLLSIDGREKKMVAYAYYRDDELMIFEIVWSDSECTDGHFQSVQAVSEVKRMIDWFLQPFLREFKQSSTIEKI